MNVLCSIRWNNEKIPSNRVYAGYKEVPQMAKGFVKQHQLTLIGLPDLMITLIKGWEPFFLKSIDLILWGTSRHTLCLNLEGTWSWLPIKFLHFKNFFLSFIWSHNHLGVHALNKMGLACALDLFYPKPTLMFRILPCWMYVDCCTVITNMIRRIN